MREPGVTVTTAPATCYTVRNSFFWAHIFVRFGTSHDRLSGPEPRHWVNLSALSDFGEFGHCWSHIGGDWRTFLAGLDFDYAMKKMRGGRFREPLSVDEAAKHARRQVIDLRRAQQACTAEQARRLFDAIDCSAFNAHDCREFLKEWDENSDGLMYRFSLYEAGWDQPSAEARGFWREIWPYFADQLRLEAAGKGRDEAAA